MRIAILFVALLALLSIVGVQANLCGNCPSNDCPGCPCGTSKLMVDITTACEGFTGWNQAQCRCIVSHESSGNAHANNFNAGGNTYDIGVWQVNTVNWATCSGGNPPCTESVNRGCAIDVWRWGGGTFKLWSTCGGCNACATESAISEDWDGTWPEGYDASRPFPDWAINSTDARIAESRNWVAPKKANKITLTEF